MSTSNNTFDAQHIRLNLKLIIYSKYKNAQVKFLNL